MRHHLPLTVTLLALCACNAQTSLQPATPGASDALRTAAANTGRLFVSQPNNGEVYLYDLPSLRLVTILQTFHRPQGECADDVGNVWVVDAGDNKIVKLDYAGKTIGQLHDTDGMPYSCAWDASSGDLAVTNNAGNGSTGNVLVYRRAMGSPIKIRNLDVNSYDFLGYDRSGDLYFDGAGSRHGFVLSEVAASERFARTIAVHGARIGAAGFVQWDPQARALDVGDQKCGNARTTCIYQLQLSGKGAQVVRETDLATYTGSKVCDVIQAVLFSGEIYGSDDEHCGYADNATYDWRYPGGGNPKKYTGKASSSRFGATVATET